MTDYIRNLRTIVGTQPLMQCGATMIVLDSDNRVLMLRRSDNGSWCFPGGSIELGERVEEAARREVFEEAGIQVGELHLVNVFSGEELYYKYPHGDEVYNIDIVYYADQYGGSINLNDESSEYAFFAISQIPEDVSPPRSLDQESVSQVTNDGKLNRWAEEDISLLEYCRRACTS